MTDNQAIFNILIGFMCVDGEIARQEIEIILDFIKLHFNGVDFNPIDEITEYRDLERKGRIGKFVYSLAYIGNKLSNDQKKKIIRYAVDVIIADKKVHDNEGILFDAVREAWGIDTKTIAKREAKLPTQNALYMTKAKAAFYILVGLMCADGEISDGEIAVIERAFHENYDKVDFDVPQELEHFKNLNREEKIEHFVKAISFFDALSDSKAIEKILDYSVEMVVADNKLNKVETFLIDLIMKEWGIDIQKYAANKKK